LWVLQQRTGAVPEARNRANSLDFPEQRTFFYSSTMFEAWVMLDGFGSKDDLLVCKFVLHPID
jgi:hypothetical protein